MLDFEWRILNSASKIHHLKLHRFAARGGMGIRTPDIQLAKLALYQLSYTPLSLVEARNNRRKKIKLCAASRHVGRAEFLFKSFIRLGVNRLPVSQALFKSACCFPAFQLSAFSFSSMGLDLSQ